jgi:hypothetical protein
MAFGSFIQAVLRLARVALAAILLVGVPLAEAATCGGEMAFAGETVDTASDASTVQVADGVAHDSKSGGDAQHCIHGHCHHSTPFKADDTASPLVVESSVGVKPALTSVVLMHVSGGLERPPKA